MVDLVQSEEARWSVIAVANAAAAVHTSGVMQRLDAEYEAYSNVSNIPGI